LSGHVARDDKDNECIQMLGRDVPGISVTWKARSGSRNNTELGVKGGGWRGIVSDCKPWAVAGIGVVMLSVRLRLSQHFVSKRERLAQNTRRQISPNTQNQ